MSDIVKPIEVIRFNDISTDHFLAYRETYDVIQRLAGREITVLDWIKRNRELFNEIIKNEYKCNIINDEDGKQLPRVFRIESRRAIHHATTNGYRTVVKEILQIVPDAVNDLYTHETINRHFNPLLFYRTPLTLAILNKDSKMVSLLIKNGAYVNFCAIISQSPLFLAIDENIPEIVFKLVSAGAIVNNRVFDLAVKRGNPLVIRTVLDAMLYS